ncbi:MAG: cation-translocating P-type ATPase [Burkholderiales bacterium]|nr:cation-translocating P-type ATPase [Burkholderiales bacterium]
MKGSWHTQTAQAVAQSIASDAEQGLDSGEALHRLERYGRNEIAEADRRSVMAMFAAQFRDFSILVLLVVAVVSGLLGDIEDLLVIAAIVVLNAGIGFAQDFRADRAMVELKRLSARRATVVRGARRSTIEAALLVPGDIVLLEAGGMVPADLRLVEAPQLKVNEAALTGEAIPVEKNVAALGDVALAIADQTNMAFMGTVVTYGRARGIVVATGMDTEFGRIAALLDQGSPAATPLQRRLAVFGRQLAIGVLGVCAIIFLAGVLRGEALLPMLLMAASLAVAVIPEALPAVVTVMLALGGRNMARRNALVRRLPAVETLGSVGCICTDKTGTLTCNQMRVAQLAPSGAVRVPVPVQAAPHGAVVRQLLEAAALSNDAVLGEGGEPMGDPTEVALSRVAAEAGLHRRELEQTMPRCMEFAFDSDRKRMTTIHRAGSGFVAYTKGAPEAVVERCTAVARDGYDDESGQLDRSALLATAEAMAVDGLRVLAVARRVWPALPAQFARADTVETGLTLIGFIGMHDPLRDGVAAAVATCRAAGITTVMVTGDHPATARAIARSLGMLEEGDTVMTGRELATLTDDALTRRIDHVKVFARLDPAQKIRIVQAIQARGRYVAMTGDGVNDAPALVHADIGVAMGKAGTDVAREAASLVLLDDNFATIVAAVEEGRRIYENIRKFMRYVLTCNSAELLVIAAAPFLGLPAPLLPIHILWINLLTDGLPGLALAAEPGGPTTMREPARSARESVFAHGMWWHIVLGGLAMAAVTLFVQGWALRYGHAAWQTMTFMVLTFSQLGHVLAVRSERESLFAQGLTSNLPLLGAIALTIVCQFAAIYVPALNAALRTSPLDPAELAVCMAMSAVVFLLVEGEKYLIRHHLTFGAMRDRLGAAKHAKGSGPT